MVVLSPLCILALYPPDTHSPAHATFPKCLRLSQERGVRTNSAHGLLSCHSLVECNALALKLQTRDKINISLGLFK